MRYSFLCPTLNFPVSEINKKVGYVGNHYDVVACIIIVRHKNLQQKIYNYLKSLNSLKIFLSIHSKCDQS